MAYTAVAVRGLPHVAVQAERAVRGGRTHLLRGHGVADVGVPLRVLLRAFHAHPHGQRLATRVPVQPRQPQPADLGHAQAAVPNLHIGRDGERRHGAVPGLEPGPALVPGIIEEARVRVGQVLERVAHAGKRVVLQPCVIRVVAQFREPLVQRVAGNRRLGSHALADGLGPRRLTCPDLRPVGGGYIHFLPAGVPPLAVGQHVIPDMAAGAGDGR